MSIYNKYPRGSEWRKWDLHFHTPSSFDYKDKSVNDKQIIDSLKANDISVVAITDHHIIDVERIWTLHKLGLEKGITILAGIEFLSDTRGKDPIHFIGIFNLYNKDKLNFIWEQIKNKTNISKIYGENKKPNEVYCDLEDTTKLIHELGGIVTIHAGRKHSSIETITNSLPHTLAQKKDIADLVDIYELGKEKDQYGYIEKVFPHIGYKPMILCSDNHDIKNYTIKTNCWIKADPTFEGLKQIIYEPKERVRIQENNPNEDFPKQVFSEIKIQETKIFGDGNVKFKQQNIPLNSNLVTIIGGRGTGKSLLLDCISKVFNKYNKRAENILIQNDDFIIEFTKFDGTKEDYKIQEDNELDYLHIHQGYVKEIVDPKETNKLDSEIKSLLNIKEIDFSKDESKIIYLIDEIFEIKNFLLKEDEEGNKVNSKQYIEKQIEKKLQLIKNITTNQNQELIKQYTENLKNINLYLHKKEDLYKFKDELNSFQNNKNLIINKINGTIEIEENKIPLISFTKQIEKIEDLIKTYEVKIDKFNNINENIKKTFVEQGIKGDITTLLEQTKNYQDEIDKLTEKLKEVEKKENSLNEKFKNIEELISSIEEDYSNYKDEVINKWQNLKNGKEDWSANQKDLIKKLLEDIEIEAEEVFEIDKFYELLIESGILNMMKFRAIKDKSSTNRIKEFFNITNKDDYKKFLKNELATQGQQFLFKDLIDSDFFNKEGAREFLKLLILDFHKYWKVITKPKYKSKELYQLSVGMKGTMFLCIKLATDPFMKPFIFDQPEDDLDNDFIVNELVPIFKEIKKYRQVIIATHNANLVVNADAEQVIIANNNNEELSYISGSIENPSIREHICNILEGGQEAFESRKNKYNFK
jgi:ABC-type histidine transport system ATPase subunit